MLVGGASGLGMPLLEEQRGLAGEAPEAEMHLCSGSAGPSALGVHKMMSGKRRERTMILFISI